MPVVTLASLNKEGRTRRTKAWQEKEEEEERAKQKVERKREDR